MTANTYFIKKNAQGDAELALDCSVDSGEVRASAVNVYAGYDCDPEDLISTTPSLAAEDTFQTSQGTVTISCTTVQSGWSFTCSNGSDTPANPYTAEPEGETDEMKFHVHGSGSGSPTDLDPAIGFYNSSMQQAGTPDVPDVVYTGGPIDSPHISAHRLTLTVPSMIFNGNPSDWGTAARGRLVLIPRDEGQPTQYGIALLYPADPSSVSNEVLRVDMTPQPTGVLRSFEGFRLRYVCDSERSVYELVFTPHGEPSIHVPLRPAPSSDS